MNATRLLGTLALVVGATLLLSEFLLSQELFLELTGNSPVTLRFICTVAIVLGVLAIGLGIREEREFQLSKEGTDT
jgi:hypothetical protein